jgi:hypothetical protein
MAARVGFGLRIGFLAASALVLLGCPNPNTYTTPRTIGSGHFQHSLAGEAWGFYIPASTTTSTYGSTTTDKLSGTFPTAPTYTLRIGLGDDWEIGARISNMTSLGADVKWNLFKSSGLDLALDPAFQVFALTASDNGMSETVTVSYLHVPLLIGLNVSRTVTLVFTPGVTWGFASGSLSGSSSGTDQASATTGAIGRFGLGADFRIMPGFALHPEITFLRGLGSDNTLIYMAGLGFNFGAMPNYDDVGGGPAPIPPPSSPPPGYYPPPGSAPPSGEPPPSAEPVPPPAM